MYSLQDKILLILYISVTLRLLFKYCSYEWYHFLSFSMTFRHETVFSCSKKICRVSVNRVAHQISYCKMRQIMKWHKLFPKEYFPCYRLTNLFSVFSVVVVRMTQWFRAVLQVMITVIAMWWLEFRCAWSIHSSLFSNHAPLRSMSFLPLKSTWRWLPASLWCRGQRWAVLEDWALHWHELPSWDHTFHFYGG